MKTNWPYLILVPLFALMIVAVFELHVVSCEMHVGAVDMHIRAVERIGNSDAARAKWQGGIYSYCKFVSRLDVL